MPAGPVIWNMLWWVLVGLFLIGYAFFVLALVRWEKDSTKYVFLFLLVVPFVPSVVGWVAYFAGGTKPREARAQGCG